MNTKTKSNELLEARQLEERITARMEAARISEGERQEAISIAPASTARQGAARAVQRLAGMLADWERAHSEMSVAFGEVDASVESLAESRMLLGAAQSAWEAGSLDRAEAIKLAEDFEVARSACRAHEAALESALAKVARNARVIRDSDHPWESSLRQVREHVADAIRWFAEDPDMTQEGIPAAVGRLRHGLERVRDTEGVLDVEELRCLAICLETRAAISGDRFKSRVRRQSDTTPRTPENWWALVVEPALAQVSGRPVGMLSGSAFQ